MQGDLNELKKNLTWEEYYIELLKRRSVESEESKEEVPITKPKKNRRFGVGEEYDNKIATIHTVMTIGCCAKVNLNGVGYICRKHDLTFDSYPLGGWLVKRYDVVIKGKKANLDAALDELDEIINGD